MRTALDKALRSKLEAAVEKARDVAELAAKEELDRLGVGEKQAPDYLSTEQRDQRNRLRAHGRFLGDIRRESGEQEVALLITEIAYEHWHRMLFSRFLAENDLLMYEDGVTALAISDCFDLAEEETGDSSKGWQYAANYASKMLPQIFRKDSPAMELEFSPNPQKKLKQLLEGLDDDTFQAQDSLGWVYQFWQSKRKDEVNKSEVKIGAKELSPVTQLFTEPYMVSFLLDNALGAWWANQQLTEQDYTTASCEQELRDKAAIDGVPLEYLRFVRTYTPEQQAVIDKAEADGEVISKPEPAGPWEPASGKFEQWPEKLSEFKTLDPCCGSGHFLVAVFLMLVPIRMQREGLTEQQAINAVLGENIHGLELDQRCVEIAVFALALEAWRYPNGGGYRQLPEMHLACSGLSVKAAKDEWKKIGLGKKNLSIALDWMHETFENAPILGSLINPRKSSASKIVQWDKLDETLKQVLSKEPEGEDKEAGIVAQGLAKSASLLGDRYHWVITNVPYKKASDLELFLQEFLDEKFPAGSVALETSFLERCIDFCVDGGVNSIVLPQNWMFLTTYKKFRQKVLHDTELVSIARLGSGAFDTISGEVVKAILFSSRKNESPLGTEFFAIDASEDLGSIGKATSLKDTPPQYFQQASMVTNPDSRIVLDEVAEGVLFSIFAGSYVGLQNGDTDKYVQKFWEHPGIDSELWSKFQMPTTTIDHYNGRSSLVRWEKGVGDLSASTQARIQGVEAWGKDGVVVRLTKPCPSALYSGDLYDQSSAAIIPQKEEHLAAIWCYCSSKDFRVELEKIDQKRNVTNATFVKVPINIDKWIEVADSKYPNGLPKPYSNDPDQWVFHGHPCGSVVWDDKNKKTANGGVRIDDSVLHVAAARLLGYQWPSDLDVSMELDDQQYFWVEESKKLLPFADDDGIVCIPAVRGEKAADQRLEELLQVAYGDAWSAQVKNQLLESAGCKNKSLSFWLQEKFFEQHSKFFQHRPFIWHIWDGLKDGFSALVNYHQLDKKNLERLIYTYLDDWIRTQSHQQSEGVDGASERLVAAQNLKQRLELILEGEAPYDIFVRWKQLEEQPVGWNPDLNDGVRLNIRPFMSVADVGKKGAGILRTKPNIHWKKDRGKDVESAPWYNLGLEYDGKEGDRINDHHLSLAEKQNAKA